jgi:phenylalanine-4-hydroxylase
MTTRLAVLEGPVLLSRAGICTLAAPWPGPAVVVFGPEPSLGPFRCELPGGFSLAGERTTEHQGTALQATWRGRPLGLPAGALLLFSPGLPSVAGGPGDPEAWDLWFGAAPVGDGEAVARRHKAEALPEGLARLYVQVARMREAGPDPDRLRQIRAELARYPEDWLLDCEIQELLDLSSAGGTGRGETGESWAPRELRGPFATQNA